MNYFTQVKFGESQEKIDYQSRLLFLGSCFSENIGEWLKDLRFQIRINPYGITYNPISISHQILNSLCEKSFDEEHQLEQKGKCIHLDLHKGLSLENMSDAILQIRNSFKKDLLQASHLFLTLGTSFAFEYKKTGKIINNCHKVPGYEFERILLNENRMFGALEEALDTLLGKNEQLKIYLTVSPIRHLRHGAIDNQRSKARLIRLCEMLEFSFKQVNYIPVYELVMDELRDYRFYRSDDLLHLNQLGLETVKSRVQEYHIHPSAYDLMNRVANWNKMKNHRLLDPASDESMKFREKLRTETNELDRIFEELNSFNR